ncbi:penicillin-binding transpeptidase domain-containing protein [Ornithinibacillus sp. L9]|uniref:serine-type D-Ala-D-Ala carboxypeptidase n=1 Tax=Ornithinibacillus caprae TaxID=2678566 RepID=A0A6N8FL34_9BACI|nr:penicillin-binding transpeptidase domain-containing protein [Ornithinibacillus caprae]MUK89064.1 penicillin-binding transpeptidase domain-containing protein [Ornithinibacillus caprae]
MRRVTLLLSIVFFVILIGCSEDDVVTPHERFDKYVEHWSNQEFSKMYEMLTPESQQEYSTENMVDRYTKIYEDLQISDVTISYTKLSDDELETSLEEGTATLPFTVEMNSMAGPISFEYEAKLTQIDEGEDEESLNWFVSWDPGFIFPEIKDGGEIGISTTEPVRGEILDRNLMPLAINDTVWEIGIVPGNFDTDSDIEKVASLLNMSVEAIDSQLSQGWVTEDTFVPLRKVPESNEELLNQLWEIDGIMGSEATGRVYPLGESAAHLVGYIRQITAEQLEEKDPEVYSPNDMIGNTGLERVYEEQLKGEKGVRIYVTKEGEEDITLAEKEVKNGEKIVTTIDANIQEEIFNSYDGEAGTTAAIHPKTGETLALVSSPSYDPNDMVYGISQSKWDSLQNDPKNPLLNRFTSTFAPGSVIKPVSAAVGLQNGSIDPNETFEIEGLTWKPEGWSDYEIRRVSESNGPVDLRDAIVRSDNIYFAMQALEMGEDAFLNGLQQFGFGESIPFEYPIETSTVSTSGNLSDPVLLANASYGQGELEISSLHMATAYTTFLNDGNMIKPTLLESEETSQVWQEELITKEQADIISEALRGVVTDGTAGYAKNANLPISGKTATVELKLTLEDEEGAQNGWFVGYPTEDQDILIAMMVEDVHELGGSSIAVEKVTDILEKIK